MTKTLAKVIFQVFAIFSVLTGCASDPAPPLPSESVRKELGTVGVVSVHFAPEESLQIPGAGEGAATAAAGSIYAGAHAGPVGLVLGIVLAPVAAVVGGIAGAAAEMPEETAAKIESQIVETLKAADVQVTLRGKVIEAAQKAAGKELVEMTNPPMMVGEQVGDYRYLHDKGIDSTLEVGALEVALVGSYGGDPDLQLFVVARTRLIRTLNNEVIFAHDTLKTQSKKHRFSEWGANDAELLRRELDQSLQRIARRIVDEVFLEFRGE
jgi:hypothetical protein